MHETGKLIPNDGAAGDWFGEAVATSGDLLIVGASRDHDDGASSGSAYVFDLVSGQQTLKLLPEDGSDYDGFGAAVAIAGERALIGAWYDDDNGYNSGSAYVFDATTGQQLFKLLPDDGAAGDWFGYSVALNGTHAIVGARLDDDLGIDSGAVYVFDLANGQQVQKIVPADGVAHAQFGFAVAIEGDTAVIGARWDDDRGAKSGSAYLYRVPAGEALQKVTASDGAPNDEFGRSVAIDDGVLLIGARFDDDLGENSGSAYLFDAGNGTPLAKLLPDDGAPLDRFGMTVALDGGMALIGSTLDDDTGADSGSAYVFDTATQELVGKITASDGAPNDQFGDLLTIQGGLLVVGAFRDDDMGADSGSVYLFELDRCPADLNSDGVVDTADLGVCIGAFGAGGPSDINGDGVVDTADVGLLIADFGTVCE